MLQLINFSSRLLLTMKKRVSISFNIKYAKLFPLRVSERFLCLQQRGLTRDNFYLQECYHYVRSSSSGVSRGNLRAELLDSAPPDSIAGFHKVGWIQKDRFRQRFKHFVRVVKPSIKIPLSRHRLVTILMPCISRRWTVLGKTKCKLFVFPFIALINCNLWEFPSYSF